MILPEVIMYRQRFSAESSDIQASRETKASGGTPARVTLNVLTTMALTFAIAVGALLALAGATLNQAIVAGAVATGAAFVNLVRRPPEGAGDLQ